MSRTQGSGWGAGPILYQLCPKCGKKKCFYDPITDISYYKPFRCTACKERFSSNKLVRQKHAPTHVHAKALSHFNYALRELKSNLRDGWGDPDYIKAEIPLIKQVIEFFKDETLLPEKFNGLNNRMKWLACRFIVGVKWCCGHCGYHVSDHPPEIVELPWNEATCEYCHKAMTKRTAGGVNDPFNYTFIYLKK